MGEHRVYDFFGRLVLVESDAAEVAAALDAVYARQRSELAPGAEADLVVRVRADAPGPRIEVGARTVRVPDGAQLAHYAHLVLVNAAAAAAADVVVLHSGAVERDGRVALLVGPSGWGKTTLTMALVGRGWGFLSDDFAVLDSEGTVRPFPRRVNLTDRSLELLGLEVEPETLRLAGFGGHEKWMVDIEALWPERLAGPAPVGDVFMLVPDLATDERDTAGWRLQLDHAPPGFEAALAGLAGVRAARRRPDAVPPVVTLDLEPGAQVVADLDAVCAAHDVTVLAATRGTVRRPSYDGPPLVAEVPLTEALPGLLAQALSLSGRRFLGGTEPAAAMLELARLHGALAATGARVHRLVPGRLEATVELVEAVVDPETT